MADYYREHTFPGKKLIGVGVVAWAVFYLSSLIVVWENTPRWAQALAIGSTFAASILYLIGYWKAIIGKGYPRILWLVGFTGIIGLIVICFLPDRSQKLLTV